MKRIIILDLQVFNLIGHAIRRYFNDGDGPNVPRSRLTMCFFDGYSDTTSLSNDLANSLKRSTGVSDKMIFALSIS